MLCTSCITEHHQRLHWRLKDSRDEFKVFLYGYPAIDLPQRGPSSAGHTNLATRFEQLAQKLSRWGLKHLNVAHEVIAFPVQVQHLRDGAVTVGKSSEQRRGKNRE